MSYASKQDRIDYFFYVLNSILQVIQVSEDKQSVSYATEYFIIRTNWIV